MEELIAKGQVMVNGRPAEVGVRVSGRDRVQVQGKRVDMHPGGGNNKPRVLIYHKPEGEIVSNDDPEGRPTVFAKLPKVRAGRWIAIGRLDFNTSGLLLFTTSGDLANRMMHPRFQLEREYAVRTMGRLSEEQLDHLTTGVMLDDGEARLHTVEDRGGGEGINHWYHVVIKEGRNREIRRLFEAVGSQVSRLIRVRFGRIELPPHLKRGQMKELASDEVRELSSWVRAQTPNAGPGMLEAAPSVDNGDVDDEMLIDDDVGNRLPPQPQAPSEQRGGERGGRRNNQRRRGGGGGEARHQAGGRPPRPANARHDRRGAGSHRAGARPQQGAAASEFAATDQFGVNATAEFIGETEAGHEARVGYGEAANQSEAGFAGDMQQAPEVPGESAGQGVPRENRGPRPQHQQRREGGRRRRRGGGQGRHAGAQPRQYPAGEGGDPRQPSSNESRQPGSGELTHQGAGRGRHGQADARRRGGGGGQARSHAAGGGAQQQRRGQQRHGAQQQAQGGRSQAQGGRNQAQGAGGRRGRKGGRIGPATFNESAYELRDPDSYRTQRGHGQGEAQAKPAPRVTKRIRASQRWKLQAT